MAACLECGNAQCVEHRRVAVYGTPSPDEQAAIDAAYPTRSGRHDIYAEAQRLVTERHEKGELVRLVNWLLRRIEEGK